MLAGLWFTLYIFKSQSSNTLSKINGEERAEPIQLENECVVSYVNTVLHIR